MRKSSSVFVATDMATYSRCAARHSVFLVALLLVAPSVLFLLSGTDQLLFATSAKSSQKA